MTPFPIRIPLASIPGIATAVLCTIAAEVVMNPQTPLQSITRALTHP